MTDDDFSGIMAGLDQTLDHVRERGAVPIVRGPDVVAIRKQTGLSQKAFAAAFGLDKRAVQEWEQARRSPDRAAVTLYRMIAKDPAAVRALLAA